MRCCGRMLVPVAGGRLYNQNVRGRQQVCSNSPPAADVSCLVRPTAIRARHPCLPLSLLPCPDRQSSEP